jgi:hypothetical protein
LLSSPVHWWSGCSPCCACGRAVSASTASDCVLVVRSLNIVASRIMIETLVATIWE